MESVIESVSFDDDVLDSKIVALDIEIAQEASVAVRIELMHLRALVLRERASVQINPELAAIMQSSAARATTSTITPLPRGCARLCGRVSAAELAQMREVNRLANALIVYVDATA
jgi:hypothetical protein